jgi:hypothetical protein
MKKITTLITLLLLASCKFNYTEPMCTQNNFADIPNLEGEFSKVVDKRIDSNVVKFVRSSHGEYQIKEAGQVTEKMNSCQIAGQYYLEGNRNDLYTLWLVIAKPNRVKFGLMELQQKLLDELNIPYTEETPESMLTDTTTIIADNRGISNEIFIQALKPDSEIVSMERVR